ncbi:MAG: Sec-independent protein translocase protein TatB [Xanthomonadales bacterium]|nr:Sec-independent protein translocase protein TatB [Xanthomonadales bacterium]
MFNLSMPELALIGVVALLVLGPERLPGAARTAGALLRRAQRSWSGLKADIERELAADELKRELEQGRQALRDDEAMASLARLRDDLAGRSAAGDSPKPPAARPDDNP